MGKLVPAWIASPLPQGPSTSSQQRERFPRLSHSQIRKAQPPLRELKPCPASRVKLRESGADLTGGRIGQAYQPSSPVPPDLTKESWPIQRPFRRCHYRDDGVRPSHPASREGSIPKANKKK